MRHSPGVSRFLVATVEELADDGYFWGHSAAAQINDRMRNIRAHPGFFRIDYNEYYLTHCRQLERFFLDLERSGIEVGSVSPSRIPALATRSTRVEFSADLDIDTVNALLDDSARRVRTRLHQLERSALTDLRFVSINPSLRGSMGHPLYQDLSIRKVISHDGSGFVSLGDARLDESINGSFVLPVFETRIWQVHRRTGEQRRVQRMPFSLRNCSPPLSCLMRPPGWMMPSSSSTSGIRHCFPRSRDVGEGSVFAVGGLF